MSEERAPYMTEIPEDNTYQIRDEATPRDYFSQVPNLVGIMDLSPHAYRLYGHVRRVAGEAGKCWKSTKTLAAECGMSIGMVSESKRELENVYPPLIRIESKKFDKGYYHELIVTDIWELNHLFYTGGEITVKTAKGAVFHNMNEYRSYYEKVRSQYETKKNPNTKEEPKKIAAKRGDPIDGILDYHLKPKAIKDAIRDYFKLTPNYETKFNREFMQWAVLENITPEQIKSAAQLWGNDKRFNWSVPTLKGIWEHWLELVPRPSRQEIAPEDLERQRLEFAEWMKTL